MFLNDSAMDTAVDLQLPGTPQTTGVTPETSVQGSTGTGFNFLTSLPDIIKSGLTAYQGVQLSNLQASLIKQGKPPLTPAQLYAMAPQVNVGLSSPTQQLVIYGGVALLGVMLLSGLSRRRH